MAQNVEPGRQSGAAGQKQGEPAGQGDTVRGQVAGQTAQGQAAQGQLAPGQTTQGQAGQQTIQQGQIRQDQIRQGQVGQPQTLQPGQQGQFTQQRQGQGRESLSDQEIANCVHGEASNEIEIAKLAQQKAQSEEVRKFAEQMVRDHTPGAQEMQRLAGNLASHTQPKRESDGGLDWVAVKNQIGQECLKSVKQELSQKSGAEFDHCFMGQQIAAHMKVVDELKVLRNYASQDLQQKLDKELQTAQQHLQHAKQIEQRLKESPSERVSRKTDGSNK
jgi:putative membrane protein